MTVLYGYRVDRGRVVHRLFDRENFPDDWFDCPLKAERASGEVISGPEAPLKTSPAPAPAPEPLGGGRRGRRSQNA